METVRRIFHWIEKIFITIAIALAIATPLALHYLPLPAEWKNEVVPTAVALAFIVILRLLFLIDKKVSTGDSYREYPTMTDAIPDMLNIFTAHRSRTHSIKVLASTAATTVNTLLPRVAQSRGGSSNRFDVQVKLIDPDSPLVALMPSHWPEETRVSINRLNAFRQEGVTVTCSKYP